MVGLPDRCRANRTLPAARQQSQSPLRLLLDFRAHGFWVGAQVLSQSDTNVLGSFPGLTAGPFDAAPLTVEIDRVRNTEFVYGQPGLQPRLAGHLSNVSAGLADSATRLPVGVLWRVLVAPWAMGLGRVDGRWRAEAAHTVLTVGDRIEMIGVHTTAVTTGGTARAGRVTIVTEVVYVVSLWDRSVDVSPGPPVSPD